MEEERRTSKHNSSVSIIIRLDFLWKDANKHAREGKFSDWNNDLDTIWRELARDLKDDEYKDKRFEKDGKKFRKLGYKSRFDAFDEELKKSGRIEDTARQGFNKITTEQIEIRAKQYEILNRKDLFLRRLENHLGKGTKFENEDEDDFD